MKRNQAGFTVLELLIAFTIFTMVFLVLMNGARQNINVMRRGDEEIFLQSQVSKLLTDIYMELTSINPCVEIDKYGDLWIAGEKDKEINPCIIKFIDKDKNKKNGYEEFYFTNFGTDRLTDSEEIRYFFQPDPVNKNAFKKNENETGYIFMKTKRCPELKTATLSENVSYLHFIPDDGPTKAINVKGEIAMKSSTGETKKYPFQFLVRFESMYIAFESE